MGPVFPDGRRPPRRNSWAKPDGAVVGWFSWWASSHPGCGSLPNGHNGRFVAPLGRLKATGTTKICGLAINIPSKLPIPLSKSENRILTMANPFLHLKSSAKIKLHFSLSLSLSLSLFLSLSLSFSLHQSLPIHSNYLTKVCPPTCTSYPRTALLPWFFRPQTFASNALIG